MSDYLDLQGNLEISVRGMRPEVSRSSMIVYLEDTGSCESCSDDHIPPVGYLPPCRTKQICGPGILVKLRLRTIFPKILY